MSEEVLLLVAIGTPRTRDKALSTKTQEKSAPVRGEEYEGAIVPDGGVGPFTYATSAGELPPGTTLDGATGAIGGVPEAQGYYEFEVTVTDAESNTFDIVYAMNVEGGIVWLTKKLPNVMHGVAYRARVEASGGIGGYAFEYDSGTFPFQQIIQSGSYGEVDEPFPVAMAVPERHQFTLRATDGKGNYALQTFEVIVWPAPQWLAPPRSDGLVGLPFEQRLDYRYGDEALFVSEWPTPTFAIESGALPPGLAISPTTGTIYGTPGTSGTYFYTVRMTDALGGSISAPMRSRIAAVTEIDQVYEGVFGDGMSNSYEIFHLLGTRPRSVVVYDNYAIGILPVVDVEWAVLDFETISVTTATPPGIDQYSIIITG